MVDINQAFGGEGEVPPVGLWVLAGGGDDDDDDDDDDGGHT